MAFDGHPAELAFETIAGLGFTAVEPAFIRGYVDFAETDFSAPAAAALRRRLDAHGLRAAAVSAHFDLSDPQSDAMLARRIGFARDLGAAILITNAGPASARDAILRTIATALPALETAGVTLALENPGHGGDGGGKGTGQGGGQGGGDLIGNGRDGAALMARIAHPRVGLNYDIGNVLTYSRGRIRPEDDLSHALPHAAHLHLKDIADDGAKGWRFCALGDGLIDWASVARRLAAHPDLPCGIELPLRLRRPGGRDPERAPDVLPTHAIRAALAASVAAWQAARADA